MTIEQNTANARARLSARERTMPPHNLAPATIGFSTYGHLLIAGSEDQIRLAAAGLSGMASITLLVTERISNMDEQHLELALNAVPELKPITSELVAIKGFLGQFQVSVKSGQQTESLSKLTANRAHFDLVLDLNTTPLLAQELLPAGYFHVHNDSDKLQQVQSELPDYIGDFEKPRYFHINSDVCAHSERGLTGCTRCLDVCPAEAISSVKEQIEINPHLCHGAGGCATACPTGAISYALPQPARLIDYLQQLVANYQEAGGEQPVILLHDHDSGRAALEEIFQQIPDNILPVELEELAAAGIEIWLGLLAIGCNHVVLLDTPATPTSMRELLDRELRVARELLSGMGYPADRIKLIDAGGDTAKQLTLLEDQLSGATQPNTVRLQARTAKRETLFEAIDLLANQAEVHPEAVSLPNGSAYGEIIVNADKCTLCLSCTAVCPTGALKAGTEQPELHFTEQSCVQCNLCERACPEQAISLNSRILLTDQRRESRVIHEEPAFECISCSKPFAPKSTVEKMIEKLSDHPYFKGPAINRLKMCEDCRVRDIHTDLAKNPLKQLEL